MPSTSKKQQRFMGMQLAKQRKSGKNDTGMSEKQLSEFAGSVHKGGSLEDITFHEDAATCDVAYDGGVHPIHKGYNDIVWGSDEFKFHEIGSSASGGKNPGQDSALRDIGNGIHMGAPVDYFGPDTDYRAEEINPQDYGRDWDPFPFKDMFKDEKKQTRPNIRIMEDAEYSSLRTPGAVTDSQPMSEAHGAVNWDGAGPDREIPDHRSFDSQQVFRRNIDELKEDVPQISGRDTKRGKNIR